MTAVEGLPPTLNQPSLVKMEDRKRPIHDQNDSAPPLKKQATQSNGTSKNNDADLPWKDDLERFQKDAIYRQMQEYRREKNSVESQLKELRRKSRYHDDHLRVIDLWFKQLIDEVKSILQPSSDVMEVESSSLPSSLLFSDHVVFEEHLKSRSSDIRTVITHLYGGSKSPAADVVDLRNRLSQLLANEKDHILELERYRAEKEELEGRLEAASLRYMVAEKKVDRAKSMTVAKLERQALLGATRSTNEEGGPVKKEDNVANGVAENSEALAELEEEHNKVVAVSEKQKEQLDKLEEENSKLTAQITELTTKSTVQTDEDYSKTELFKSLKQQHEETIKRVNHLEALNLQLQEEAVKLQSERTAFKSQLEHEARVAIAEKDALLGTVETALSRIRSSRDELLADQAIRKASMDHDFDSLKRLTELCSANEERIKALESENERLTTQPENAMQTSDLDDVDPEELRVKYQELERKYTLLNSELSSMSGAFQRTSKLASQKVSDQQALDDRVLRLSAEKAKADQKYFAAMKSKESREQEVRTLKLQNTKSSDVVSQLRDAEASSRALVANLEKQLAEAKDTIASKTNEHRACQQHVNNTSMQVGGLQTQLAELMKTLTAKDAILGSSASACRSAELELSELRATLADTKRNLQTWKVKGLSGDAQGYEMLRTVAYCTVCRKDLKNTVIKTCGHTFCNNCVEERIASRARKCPNCGKSFGQNDTMKITL